MENYLANALPYLSDKPEKIEMIDANSIIPNKKNFYGIRDIEKLAKSIALSGHVSPLEVVPQDDGTYRLLSGERRRAAVLMLKERGEIDNTLVPCIVREKFVGNEDLTADQMEMISIISANDYREKTPFELLDEVLQLEPIARAFWKKEQMKAEGNVDDFRKFFATKFLGMSSSSLQRILVYQKLIPVARMAFNEGKIKKTALSLIASWPEDVQRQYFEALNAGGTNGKIEDLRSFQSQHANEISSRRRIADTPANAGVAENAVDENADATEKNGGNGEHVAWSATRLAQQSAPAMPDFPTDVNPNLSPEEAEKDGTNWVIEALNCMAKMAEEKSQKAAEDGHNREAKLWNLRKAAVELVIERMK